MSKFYEDPKFKTLRDKWYKRLKQVGFEDAEQVLDHDLVLKQFSANVLSRYAHGSGLELNAKVLYFQALSANLAEHPPEDEGERLILEMTSQGMLVPEMAPILKAKGLPYGRETIRYVVRRYETKWKIQTWTADKLRKKTAK